MSRKVIQITNDNITLCDDGTMWKFKIMETTSAESEGYDYSTDWTQLDGVPQSGVSNHVRDYEEIPKTTKIKILGGIVSDTSHKKNGIDIKLPKRPKAPKGQGGFE